MNAVDTNPKTIEARYILLVRHGHREKIYEGAREAAGLLNRTGDPAIESVDKADVGLPTVKALSYWVAEVLDESNLKVTAAYSSKAADAKETAKQYLTTFKPKNITSISDATENDGLLVKLALDQQLEREKCQQPLTGVQIHATSADANKGNVILICGHQPHITAIVNAWLGGPWLWRRRPGLPLREGEAVLLELAPKPHLRWAVTKSDSETTQSLRDKIASKVELTKVFAAATSVVIGLLMQTTDQPEPKAENAWYWLGFGFLVWSLVWTLLALCAYDRLSMPRMFWTRGSRGQRYSLPYWFRRLLPGWVLVRPPTREHWILFSAMLRVWLCLFVPALVTFVLGISFLLIHVFRCTIAIWVIVGLWLLLSYWWYGRAQPELGPQD